MLYLRYQSVSPNHRGVNLGIFALVNSLGRGGELSEEEHVIWRAGNDWYDAAYPNPSSTDPEIYDHELNPGAVAWFKGSAHHLLERVEPYLKLLDAHQIGWEKLTVKVSWHGHLRGRRANHRRSTSQIVSLGPAWLGVQNRYGAPT